MREELRRTRTALKGIKIDPKTDTKKIVPRIHRITFSMGQRLLNKRIGPLARLDDPRPRMVRSYPKVAYYWVKRTRVSIFFSEYEPNEYMLPCILELTYRSQKDLVVLSEELPELKVRSVEYTIDFFCEDPQSVSDLFTVLVRNMYFKYAKSAEFKGGPFNGWREERKENAVLRVGKYAKIYERGPDKKGKLKGDKYNPDLQYWDMADVDRVRLEFTVVRRNAGKKKLETIKEFIQSPDFRRRIYEKILFRVFQGSEILPTDGEEYYKEDKFGKVIVFECFQQAYLYWKKRIGNISNYVKPAEHLTSFRKEIRQKLMGFEVKWAKRKAKHMN